MAYLGSLTKRFVQTDHYGFNSVARLGCRRTPFLFFFK